jgi:hypothetical protein
MTNRTPVRVRRSDANIKEDAGEGETSERVE